MKIKLPLNTEQINLLKAGDQVELSGKILIARDAAHQKLLKLITEGKKLPVELKDQIIFYAGPVTDERDQIVAIGPTTSYRMDQMTIALLEQGVKGFIGKGKRAEFIDQACQKYQAIYFVAIGGIAALLAKQIISTKIIAYPELGTEAIRELTISNFPVIVACDVFGGNIFKRS